MDKKMIAILALIAAAEQKLKIPMHYTKKFEGSGNTYLSNTETIRIDDMLDHFVVAGVVGRDDALPILERPAFSKLEFEPDIIGGTFKYKPSDRLSLDAGMPTYTKDGKEIKADTALEAKYSKIIAAAIANRKERQYVDAYLKGIYRDKNDKTHEVGVKSNTTLPLAGIKISDKVIELATAWAAKNGALPKIELGLTTFNNLKNEANDSSQNVNSVKLVFENDGVKLSMGTLMIEMLHDAKGTDGTNIDTSKMMILSDPSSTLATGYGCLEFGDKAGNGKLIKAQRAAGAILAEATSGSMGLWGKSAPMPVILKTDLFKRYACTF